MKVNGLISIVSLNKNGDRLMGTANMKRAARGNECDHVDIVLMSTNDKQMEYFKAGAQYYIDGELAIENGKPTVYVGDYSKVNNNGFYNKQQAPEQSGVFAAGYYKRGSASSQGGYKPQGGYGQPVPTQATQHNAGYAPTPAATSYAPAPTPTQAPAANGYAPQAPVAPQAPTQAAPVAPQAPQAHVHAAPAPVATTQAPTAPATTPQNPGQAEETIGGGLSNINF